jgi:hypothetical protein
MAAFLKVNIILLDVLGVAPSRSWVRADHNNLFTTIYTVLYGRSGEIESRFSSNQNARLCRAGCAQKCIIAILRRFDVIEKRINFQRFEFSVCINSKFPLQEDGVFLSAGPEKRNSEKRVILSLFMDALRGAYFDHKRRAAIKLQAFLCFRRRNTLGHHTFVLRGERMRVTDKMGESF